MSIYEWLTQVLMLGVISGALWRLISCLSIFWQSPPWYLIINARCTYIWNLKLKLVGTGTLVDLIIKTALCMSALFRKFRFLWILFFQLKHLCFVPHWRTVAFYVLLLWPFSFQMAYYTCITEDQRSSFITLLVLMIHLSPRLWRLNR